MDHSYAVLAMQNTSTSDVDHLVQVLSQRPPPVTFAGIVGLATLSWYVYGKIEDRADDAASLREKWRHEQAERLARFGVACTLVAICSYGLSIAGIFVLTMNAFTSVLVAGWLVSMLISIFLPKPLA